MELLELLGASWSELGSGTIAGILAYLFVIIATRVLGLRTFSKMSAFDFVMTLATGSILASAAVGSTSLASAAMAIGSLFAIQWLILQLRRMDVIKELVDNTPVLLMDGDKVLWDNLTAAMVTEADLMAKLRANGVLQLAEVRYVVLETNGDISVLASSDPTLRVEPEKLLLGVSRGHQSTS